MTSGGNVLCTACNSEEIKEEVKRCIKSHAWIVRIETHRSTFAEERRVRNEEMRIKNRQQFRNISSLSQLNNR
jgi:hypothetical protein